MAIKVFPEPSPLPTQVDNSGKFLTTNGTSASWETVSADPIPQILMLGGM